MNAYDFDKTLFYPDSSFKFCMWYAKRHPLSALRNLPTVIWVGLLFALKLISKEKLKAGLFRYLTFVKDIDGEVKHFWDENENKISPWYLKQKKPDDLIISASPEFLIEEIGSRLGVKVMATPMNRKTGIIHGANCHGKEKVRRFYEAFPNGKIENFYSDSFVDTPMAEIADNAFMIVDKAQRPIPWPAKK